MKVLVTGASGFIGAHLVKGLSEKGYELYLFVRRTSKTEHIERYSSKIFYGDICDPSTIDDAVNSVDAVIHNAGCIAAKNRERYFEVNQIGTRNLIESCLKKRGGMEKFLYVSSQAAAGPSPDGTSITEDTPPRPINSYGKSKLKGEEEVLKAKGRIPVVIVRPSVVYGPGDPSTFIYFNIVCRYRLKPFIGKGDTRLNIIYVEDLVRGIISAFERDSGQGGIYFLTKNPPITMLELVNLIEKASGKRALPLPIPRPIVTAVSSLIELLPRGSGTALILNREKGEEMLQRAWVVSTDKAERELLFNAEVLPEDGINITYKWYKDNGWL